MDEDGGADMPGARASGGRPAPANARLPNQRVQGMLDALLCRWGPLRATAVLDALVMKVRGCPGGGFPVEM